MILTFWVAIAISSTALAHKVNIFAYVDNGVVYIVSVLKEAESHGLNPDSYFVDRIDQYWGSKDTAGLVRLHLLSQGTELQRTTRSNYSSYKLIGGCNYNV